MPRSTFHGRIIFNAALTVGSLCFFLIFLELIARFFHLGFPPPFFHLPQGFLMEDSILGFKLRPNFQGEWDFLGRKIRLKTNSHGMRDDEYIPQKDDVVILGLGDSFAMGYGVESEETFYSILERELNQRQDNGRRYIVLNGGVAGYGTVHQLAYLQTHGANFKPYLIILQFYPTNDFFENELGIGGFTVVENQYLQVKIRGKNITTGEAIGQFLKRHSAVFCFMGYLARDFFEIKRQEEIFSEYVNNIRQNGFEKEVLQQNNEFFYGSLNLIRRVSEYAKGIGAKMLFVLIPDRCQVPEGPFPKYFNRIVKSNPKEAVIEKVGDILMDFCTLNGICALDLRGSFKKSTNMYKERIYFKYDSHLTARGHTLAGEAMYDTLISEKLIP